MEATDESVQLVERVAALDIGKASLMACIRVPHERIADRRRQEVNEYATITAALLIEAATTSRGRSRRGDRQRARRHDGTAVGFSETLWAPPGSGEPTTLSVRATASRQAWCPGLRPVPRQVRAGVAGSGSSPGTVEPMTE
jgi:hypothetical protein